MRRFLLNIRPALGRSLYLPFFLSLLPFDWVLVHSNEGPVVALSKVESQSIEREVPPESRA